MTLTLCTSLLMGCNPATINSAAAIKRGQDVFAKECSQCHGATGAGAGEASLGLGVAPPDLTVLSQRNDGTFPREYVRRFVMGLNNPDNPAAAMPEFANTGLRHVYPDGGADGEVLEAAFEDMLDYLESIQK
ncbi:c-type cytochrome [uncultured Sulfitobacter sp.]|uniref:c-type cytochrome n=1 Tax=uncultured Sulfitobacter sp. TaxID=191468 RepID=UPI002624F6E6|nr:c-type cytochrome [uncultured Sulfitobacter sp.]